MSKPDKILADKAIGLKEDVATVQLKHTDFMYTYEYDENFNSKHGVM